MTTLADARAELVAALTAEDVDATSVVGAKSVPYVLVTGGGLPDPGHMVRGAILAEFRLVFLAGAPDQARAVIDLDRMKLVALSAVRQLTGWRMGAVGPDGIRTYGGGEYLSAALTVGRFVDMAEGEAIAQIDLFQVGMVQ